MQQRPLGSQGLVCSQQGLGCMTMTAFYGKFNRKESETQSIEAIGKALEMGVNMLGNHSNALLSHLYTIYSLVSLLRRYRLDLSVFWIRWRR